MGHAGYNRTGRANVLIQAFGAASAGIDRVPTAIDATSH